mmetsp:Transcript_6418/g.18331  ORF Transcript_6418/g.18331 Transcript_6418/m.18331 type:complete len:339 (+) Transcript_6418:735-1751(+)
MFSGTGRKSSFPGVDFPFPSFFPLPFPSLSEFSSLASSVAFSPDDVSFALSSISTSCEAFSSEASSTRTFFVFGSLSPSSSLLSPSFFLSLPPASLLVSPSAAVSMSFSRFSNRFRALAFSGATFFKSATKKPPVFMSCGRMRIQRSRWNLDISSGVGGKHEARILLRIRAGTSSCDEYSDTPADSSIFLSSSPSSIEFGLNSDLFVITGAVGSTVGSSPVTSIGAASVVSVLFSFSLLFSAAASLDASPSPSDSFFLFFSSHSFRLAIILGLFFFFWFLSSRALLDSARFFQVVMPGRASRLSSSGLRSTNSSAPSDDRSNSATTASFSIGFIEHVE